MGLDMPVVCENLRFGPSAIECLEYAPATTKKLANKVFEFVSRQANQQATLHYGALLREHGVIVAADNLPLATDYIKRLETNAYIATQSLLLKQVGYSFYHDGIEVAYELMSKLSSFKSTLITE